MRVRVNTLQKIQPQWNSIFMDDLSKLIRDYFTRKKDKNAEGYDPMLDMNMFIYTIEGFALVNCLYG